MRTLASILLFSSLALSACTATSTVSTRTQGVKLGESKQELIAGNQRFLAGAMDAHTWSAERVIETGAFGQSPSIGVLTCADSRTPPEIIFDCGVGDLFVVRMAGNVEDAATAGTFEYGYAALGMHTLLVMGHTKCGAVTAAVDGKPLPGNMPAFMNAITPALTGLAAPKNGADGKPDMTPAAEANVRWQMKQTLARSEMLTKAAKEGKLTLLCAIYDVDTGEVRFLD
jgi:carbonic anhydrase